MQSEARHMELVAAEGFYRSTPWRKGEAFQSALSAAGCMHSGETLPVVLRGVSPQPSESQRYLWCKLLCFSSLTMCVSCICADLYSSRTFGAGKHYHRVGMAFIQREWKTWVKLEFLTGLKSLLSFTWFEAVSHYLFEMEFKFKNHNVNDLESDVILCTHNGDNLEKTIAGNLFLGEKWREVFWAWHFYDSFWSLRLLPDRFLDFWLVQSKPAGLWEFEGVF